MKKSLIIFLFLFPVILAAQVADDFADGDFTNNPVWAGDAVQFHINTSLQLQLNSTIADTSYLSTASTYINNSEWDFWVKLSFATSPNNYGRVYLVSDQSNLQGPLNGYFVQLGDIGDGKDSISLFKQSGLTLTKIIPGTIEYTNNSTNTFRVMVTRDNLGNWNLYSDVTGGINFSLEGNGFDNTFTSSSYMGVFCKYTISNATKFYFDDFNAGPIAITSQPSPASSCANGSTSFNIAATGNGTNYQWEVNCGSGWSYLTNTGIYSGANTSALILTGLDNSYNGCQYQCIAYNPVDSIISNAVNLTVYTNPIANIFAADTSICIGQSVLLAASGGGTYFWSTSETTYSITVNPIVGMNYSVTVTDGNACSDDATIHINVNPLPPVTASPDTTINLGAAAQLNATGAIVYAWSPPYDLSCTNCPNPIANPIVTTIYYVTGVDANGCSAGDSVTVFIIGSNVMENSSDLFDISAYPNPFSNSINISYTLQDRTKVNIEIYNVFQEKVADIVNTTQAPGNYMFEFKNGENKFANSVYYVRAMFGDSGVIRKVIKL